LWIEWYIFLFKFLKKIKNLIAQFTSLHVHVDLKCTQYGWEEHIVMWLRMGMMNIIEWWFSGGCLSSKEHAMM
jgi:hypothetical protein